MPDWEAEDVQRWMAQAKRQQNALYDVYGDKMWWNGDPKTNRIQLQMNLASVLFGPPPIQGQMNLDNFGYKSKELKLSKNMSRTIIRHFEGNISIAVVFVSAKVNNDSQEKPVFRVWNRDKQLYIDPACRVYKDWQCFTQENNISKFYVGYPKNGRYELEMISGDVDLGFEVAPEFRTKRFLLRLLDICSNVASLAGLIILITAEFIHKVDSLSIGWSIFFALVILYNIAKFIYLAYDMYKHR